VTCRGPEAIYSFFHEGKLRLGMFFVVAQKQKQLAKWLKRLTPKKCLACGLTVLTHEEGVLRKQGLKQAQRPLRGPGRWWGLRVRARRAKEQYVQYIIEHWKII
jgi:hypothetical protein